MIKTKNSEAEGRKWKNKVWVILWDDALLHSYIVSPAGQKLVSISPQPGLGRTWQGSVDLRILGDWLEAALLMEEGIGQP